MKTLLKIAAGLLVLILIALVAVVVYVDQIAEAAVERGGTHALGVETKVGSADVGLLAGDVELERLRVANPEGFSEPDFLSVEHLLLEVSTTSLREPVVEVPRLVMDSVRVVLEKREGRTNYKVILENLERLQKGKKDPAPEDGKKFIIRHVLVANVTATVDLLPVGGELLPPAVVQIPEIQLENVGTSDEGMSISELTAKLVQLILEAIVQQGGGVIPAEILKDIQGQLAQLPDMAFQIGEGVIQSVEKIGEGLQKGAEQATEEIGKQLEGLLKKKP
jgi:hypothetical protein